MTNIYRYLDYREALENIIEMRKAEDSKVNLSQLSESLRIQKTYTSRVFSKKAHFSTDQLYLTCQFFGLNKDETHFLFLLLEYQRTGLAERKKQLLAEVRKIQSERLKIQKHIKASMVEPEQSSEKYLEYFLEPRAALVHTYFNLPSYRRNPDLIRQALSLSEKHFKAILKILEKLEIIRWNSLQKAYDLVVDRLHLTKESPLSFPAEQLSRVMILNHLKELPLGERLYYSFTFSADERTRAGIHEEFLKFLQKVESEIKAAPSEGIYHMSFDLFPWQIGKVST